ncbi:MAG: hypothetical protein ACNS61_08485 [Candidatus Wenzhouxiangella sp. M2_3B_020]
MKLVTEGPSLQRLRIVHLLPATLVRAPSNLFPLTEEDREGFGFRRYGPSESSPAAPPERALLPAPCPTVSLLARKGGDGSDLARIRFRRFA